MSAEKIVTSPEVRDEPFPVELMNTVKTVRGEVVDFLATDEAATAWLNELGKRVCGEDGATKIQCRVNQVRPVTSALRQLRAALRLLAAEVTGDERPAVIGPKLTHREAVDVLNSHARVWPELVWPRNGEPSRHYATDGTAVDWLVSVIAHQGIELFTGPEREKLRRCVAEDCLWYFVKDNRREWCSAKCGTRHRVRQHYYRQQEAKGEAAAH